ncbi:hypothetical protein [Daejeonella sp.]|uniref:hypothetical protein n=1 Tax=Daejeonella sp. TaxID=2805397 RepID=UPI0030C542FE
MEFNYTTVGIILFIAIVIIFVLIRRNKKDQKDFEKNINESEMLPDEHKQDDPL